MNVVTAAASRPTAVYGRPVVDPADWTGADLLDMLTEPYCWTKHGEKDADERPFYESPVFNFLDGRLCTAFGPQHMMKGHALPEAPDMTARQNEAIDYVSDLAEDAATSVAPPCTGFGRSRSASACCGASGSGCRRGDALSSSSTTTSGCWPCTRAPVLLRGLASEPERKRVLWRLWLRVPEPASARRRPIRRNGRRRRQPQRRPGFSEPSACRIRRSAVYPGSSCHRGLPLHACDPVAETPRDQTSRAGPAARIPANSQNAAVL